MAVRQWRDHLPQFFGDEGNDRVCQAQGRFEYAQQRTTGRALLRVGSDLHLNFCDFDVPIAVFVPYELVDGAGGIVETVFPKPSLHLCFRFLQNADDPAVGLRKIQVPTGTAFVDGVFLEPAVPAFAIHQHEAAGVPQLVAEISVTFATVQVKVECPSERGQRRESKSHCIGTECRNAFRIILA